ncbi:MAG: hypothetical protein WDO14_14215 [Bacteroidota bacterium]
MMTTKRYHSIIIALTAMWILVAGCDPDVIKPKDRSTLSGSPVTGEFDLNMWISATDRPQVVFYYPGWTENTEIEFRSAYEITYDIFSPAGVLSYGFQSIPKVELKGQFTTLDTALQNISKIDGLTLGIRDAHDSSAVLIYGGPYEGYTGIGRPISYHRAVVMKKGTEIWITGGYTSFGQSPATTYGVTSNVKKSFDGITWTDNTTNLGGRDSHAAVVMPDPTNNNVETAWVIGGRLDYGNQGSYPMNDVKKSTNGTTWTTVNAGSLVDLPFPPRWGHAVVVMKDPGNANKPTMWMIAGEGWDTNADDTMFKDVYKSVDGNTWTKVTPTGTYFSARRDHQAVVMKDQTGVDNIWLIGGFDGTNYSNEVWRSPNGVNWTKMATPPFAARSEHQAFVMKDPNDGINYLWVIGGQTSTTAMNDVWKTADGVRWTRITNTGPYMNFLTAHQVVVFPDPASGSKDHMFILGGILSTGYTSLGYVVKSPDGSSFRLGTNRKFTLEK